MWTPPSAKVVVTLWLKPASRQSGAEYLWQLSQAVGKAADACGGLFEFW